MKENIESQLRREIAEYADLTGRLARLLTETANALKGKPDPLTLHDWSDLPYVAMGIMHRLKKLENKI